MRLPTFAEWLQRKFGETVVPTPGAAAAAPAPNAPAAQAAADIKAQVAAAAVDPKKVAEDPTKVVNQATLQAAAKTTNPTKVMSGLNSANPAATQPGVAKMKKG